MRKKIALMAAIIVLFCAGSASDIYSGEIKERWNLGPIFFGRPTGEIGFSLREDIQGFSSNGDKTAKEYRLFSEELKLEERLFVYHPRFLELKIGGGLLFGQGQREYRGEDLLKNFDVEGLFLKMTPYNGSFFFRKHFTDIGHTPSVDYLAERTSAGLAFHLDKTVVGWPFDFRFDGSDSSARDIFRSEKYFGRYDFNIEEKSEAFEVKTQKQWKSFELNLLFAEQLYSRNFSLNQKKYESDYAAGYFQGSLAGKFLNQRLRTSTNFNFNSRNGVSDYSRFSLNQNQRFWIFKDDFQKIDSFFIFNFSRTERENAPGGANENKAFAAKEDDYKARGGFSHYLGESLLAEIEGGYEKTDFSVYEQRTTEALARADYSKNIFPSYKGKLFLDYGVSWSEILRTGKENVFVGDELHKISDYEAVVLAGREISTDSVVITDVSGVIVYQEGIDYRIYRLGSLTYVERIPGTRILNGENLLIDYENLVPRGSTQSVIQTFSWRISFFDGLIEPYFQLKDINQKITGNGGSDYSQLMIDSGQSRIYGFNSRHVFKWRGAEINGGVEFEDNDQTLYPFRRTAIKMSLTVPLNENLRFVWSGNKTDVDYREPRQNDALFLNSRLNAIYEINKTRISGGITYDSSVAGNIERDILALQLGFSHQIRQWFLNTSVKKTFEERKTVGTGNEMEKEGLSLKIYLSRRF